MNILKYVQVASSVAFACVCSFANAGIMLGGTRVLYVEPSKEASIMVMNQGPQDIMIQSWIEPDKATGVQDVPFVVTPALSRLGAGRQQLLRILYSGEALPRDRESVFRLSVQEIPQVPEQENTLQVAVRQRIKLFYRPAGLAGKSEEAPRQLSWRLVEMPDKTKLELRNPSMFHVSFASVTVRSGAAAYSVSAGMIGPGEVKMFDVQGLSTSRSTTPMRVEFNSINDYGGHDAHVSTLQRP